MSLHREDVIDVHYLGTIIEKLVTTDEDVRVAERRRSLRRAARKRRWWQGEVRTEGVVPSRSEAPVRRGSGRARSSAPRAASAG